MTGKTIQTNQLPYGLAALILCLMFCGCNSRASNSAASAEKETGTAVDHAEKAFKNIKFRSYEVIDVKQGGLATYRLAVPQDWKTTSRMDWNYNDLYQPVHTRSRVESPDGGSWVENFPSEFFVWVTPPSGSSVNSAGGINHPNITLTEALVRYVIVPNRRNVKNLRIVGSRPVNMTKAFPNVISYLLSHGFREGQGICLAVQYEQDGSRVDEEFYGYMPAGDAIQDNNGPLRLTEYHRVMVLAHSMGAKAGKLESVRPLLGFIATSIEFNPAWMTRLGEVQKMQMDRYNQAMAQTYAGIRAAGERSRAISAQNDAFINQIEATRAAQNRTQSNAPSSSFSADSNEEFDKRTDAFDQYVRGTEHMKDQYGAVSDHSSDYNYHWADGYGNYVHTNDPSNDPNKYLNGNYERMQPVR